VVRRRALLGGGGGLVWGAGAGPFLGCRPGSGRAGGLLVYTSIAVDVANQILEAFGARFPQFPATLYQLGSEAMIRRIENECEAGGIRADVIMLADPSYYMLLKMQGDLLRYVSPEAKAVPLSLRDPDGYYTAVRVINMGLARNTGRGGPEQAPANRTDITQRQWQGQVVMSSPLYSGSTYATVATLAQRYGWRYFERLRENGVVVELGTQGVERRLAAGEFKAGIAIDYSIRQGRARGSPLDLVIPLDGAVVLPSPIAIIKKGRDQYLEAAQAFHDFMLSVEGQRSVVDGHMVPVRPDVERPPEIPTAQEMLGRSLPIDWVYLATSQQQIKDTWRRTMQ
jgi:iron(III) transport system substrate-binding protein